MSQFYNDKIEKNISKLYDEVQDAELDTSKLIVDLFGKYITESTTVNRIQFKQLVDEIFKSVSINRIYEALEKQNDKNFEFDGKQIAKNMKVDVLKLPLTFTNTVEFLKSYYEWLEDFKLSSYKTYQQMVLEWSSSD